MAAGSNLKIGITDTGSGNPTSAVGSQVPFSSGGSSASSNSSFQDMVDYLSKNTKSYNEGNGNDWGKNILDPLDLTGGKADARERVKLQNERMGEAYKLAREDTAVQRRVADLKAAGINPVLAGVQSLSGMNQASASGAASSPGSRSNAAAIGIIIASVIRALL